MRIEPAAALEGHFAVPGDKSVSHRSLLFGAISRRRDPRPRLRALGRHASRPSAPCARSASRSTKTATRSPSTASACAGCARAEIDCGNAGTLARLIAGILAFQDGDVRRSPATRRSRAGRWSASPSRCAGWARRSRRPTATCRSRSTGGPLQAIDYELPVASAQVKSAVLLAGLGATGRDDGDRAARRRATTPS